MGGSEVFARTTPAVALHPAFFCLNTVPEVSPSRGETEHLDKHTSRFPRTFGASRGDAVVLQTHAYHLFSPLMSHGDK